MGGAGEGRARRNQIEADDGACQVVTWEGASLLVATGHWVSELCSTPCPRELCRTCPRGASVDGGWPCTESRGFHHARMTQQTQCNKKCGKGSEMGGG